MQNRRTGFSHGDEVQDILTEMSRRDIPISSTIRNLLRVFRDNGYQIPVMDSHFQEMDEGENPEPAI